MSTLLQIVPRVPGGLDGVGDYSLTIAGKLREKFHCDTVFAAFGASEPRSAGDFQVVPLAGVLDPSMPAFDYVLLHYVNYGFQKRGVPFRLLSIVQALRQQHRGRLVTILHELYASGPPWTSAFWLQPLQIRLAKSIARLSDVCIVSSDHSRRELIRLVPDVEVELHPIPSGLGEPSLAADQIANRDPHRWVIFGGTVLAERSLRSFKGLMSHIPESIAPRHLFLLGGEENSAARALLADLKVESTYRPRIDAAEASEILRTCSFAWLDYFHRPDIETSIILKSSVFGSLCAHAVIPVLAHCASQIAVDGDRFPGPFFVGANGCELPEAGARAGVAKNVYDRYRRSVASEILVTKIAGMLGLSDRQE